MASYYPEGECFFVRSSLKYADHWSAENTGQFYNHVLIEYSWNGWRQKNTERKQHRRSSFKSGYAHNWNTRFGDWDRFYVGESVERNPDNMVAASSHQNSLNWNECRDIDGGGPFKFILRPIKIQRKDTKWLWIDATVPIRAIYFPVCQKTDAAFPDLCTYVVLDFKMRQSIQLKHLDSGRWQDCPISKAQGLGWNDELTWGFNIPDILIYLSIPRKLRNPEQGLFRTKMPGDELVVCARSNRHWNLSDKYEHTNGFYRQMDLAEVMSATFGVEVGWRPYKHSSFVVDLVKNVVSLGLGFVPAVGPLLSVAFSIGVQLIENPDSFCTDNVLQLSQEVLSLLITQAGKSKKFMAKGIVPKKSIKPAAKVATMPIPSTKDVTTGEERVSAGGSGLMDVDGSDGDEDDGDEDDGDEDDGDEDDGDEDDGDEDDGDEDDVQHWAVDILPMFDVLTARGLGGT